MSSVANSREMELTGLKKRFYIAAALCLIVAVGWVNQQRRRVLLEKTVKELTGAESGLRQVKAANANRRQVLAALQSKFAQGAGSRSSEMVLYEKVDELNTTLKPDDMIISGIEKKEGEASLQFTLIFNNPDFTALLNMVSALHTAVFPLTPISSITVTQADAKGNGGVSFRVVGKIVVSEKTKP